MMTNNIFVRGRKLRFRLLAILIFTVVASIIIFKGFASVPTAKFEAESATLTSGAVVGSNAQASNGQFVQFNPTPTPPPPPAGFVIRDATNTGPAGTLTSCPGNRDITVAGTVIANCTINGSLGIMADNVTIRNSRVNGSIRVGRGVNGGDKDVHNPIIEDTEIISNGDLVGINGVQDFDGIYRRNNIHGWQNCMTMWTSTRAQILDSWCHDELSNEAGQHFDGIELYGVKGGLIFRGNSVYQTNSNGATAPLNITPVGDTFTGTIIVENNLFRSANPAYVVLSDDGQGPGPVVAVFNSNRLWPASSNGYWDLRHNRAGSTYSGTGNVNHNTGAAISNPN